MISKKVIENFFSRINSFLNTNIFKIVVIYLFVYVVLTNCNFSMVYHDELHAYIIAKQYSFVDIIRLMRAEGHTFIWYLLLKFIPNVDWSFPWAIKRLSFAFSLISVILLLYKSPFSIIEKILIISTFPMLSLYPVLARPYSLGIMLIFILTILYKKRLEHPILFASLIFITANTSLMAAIGALNFSIIFIYDLIKTKNKNSFYPILILFVCALTLYIQWHNPISPQYWALDFSLSNFLFKNYSHNEMLFGYIAKLIFPLFIFVTSLFFMSNKRNLFLFWSNILILLWIFYFIYRGTEYHYYFLYIYLIVSYWIQLEEQPKPPYHVLFVTFFIIISTLFNTYNRTGGHWFHPFQEEILTVKLINRITPQNSTVYCSLNSFDFFYIFKNVIHFSLKDYEGKDLFRFYNNLNMHNYNKQHCDFDKIIKNASPNSYILIDKFVWDRLTKTNMEDFFAPYKSYSLNRDLKLYKIR